MKALFSKNPFFRKYGKKALVVYIAWCIIKGILVLLVGARLFN